MENLNGRSHSEDMDVDGKDNIKPNIKEVRHRSSG
jgi:hypothetical protein